MKHYEITSKIIYPISVNIASAVILFLLAMVFKDSVIGLFNSMEIRDYPILCILEPIPDSSRVQTCDLYIINLTNDKIKTLNLINIINADNPKEQGNSSPDIHLSMKHKSSKIIDIKPAVLFNRDKGEIQVDRDGGDWVIKIIEMGRNSIFKFRITTNHIAPFNSRNDKGSVYAFIEIKYAGRK